MNDRHRQVAKAQRMLAQKGDLYDRFLTGVNFEAFRKAAEQVQQAFQELARSVTEVLIATAEELKTCIDLESLRAITTRIRGLGEEGSV